MQAIKIMEIRGLIVYTDPIFALVRGRLHASL